MQKAPSLFQRKLVPLNFPTIFVIYVMKGHLMLFLANRFIHNYGEVPYLEKKSKLFSFFSSVVLGPLIETFIYQYIIYLIYFSIFSKNSFHVAAAVLISSTGFAMSHNYNFMAVISAFLSGIILGYAYFFCKPKHVSPFWTVALLHAGHNFYAFIINNL
jgi:hypothetical protein